jgi:chromosome segregation ATPase
MKPVSLEVSMMKRIGELKSDLSQMTAWGRGLEHDKRLLEEENARLKAELRKRALDSLSDIGQLGEQSAEIAQLKDEVERLTSDIQMEKENEDRLVREWQKANNEVYGLQRQVAALIDNQTRLKAEVERLTAFTTRTIIPNEELQAQVEQLQNRCDFLEGKQP